MLVLIAVIVSGCAETQFLIHTAKRINQDEAKNGRYKVGNPYQIEGIWYYPAVDYDYEETGIASWYGPNFHGKQTANGGIFDMNALTAAHRTLPMPSIVEVTNLENGRQLRLLINDRGPFAKERIIDISRRGAQLLGFQTKGTAKVRVRILADESQQLAQGLQSGDILARDGTPITVEKLPKASVDSQSLPPLPGEKSATLPTSEPALESTGATSAGASGNSVITQLPEVVTAEPVSETSIFVQVGAYSRFDNANRASAVLSQIGTVKISSVLINGRDLFRVRLGPISSVAQADLLLNQAVASGYTDARIIID